MESLRADIAFDLAPGSAGQSCELCEDVLEDDGYRVTIQPLRGGEPAASRQQLTVCRFCVRIWTAQLAAQPPAESN